MKKIYVTGHGLMAPDANKDGVVLKHRLYTYCKDNKMLEGGVGTTSIVDTGEYAPRDKSSKDDMQAQVFEAETRVAMHYAYGGTGNMGDYAKSVKMANGKKLGLQQNKIQLASSAGQLFKLDDDEFLYCTHASTILTALDAIQEQIDVKLPRQEYEIHWVACRSYLEGETSKEKVEYVRDNGADGSDVNQLVTSAGTYVFSEG